MEQAVLLLLQSSGLRSIRSSAAADPKQAPADRCLVQTWAKEAQTVVLVQPGNPLQATGKPHLAADCPTTIRPAAAAANLFLVSAACRNATLTSSIWRDYRRNFLS